MDCVEYIIKSYDGDDYWYFSLKNKPIKLCIKNKADHNKIRNFIFGNDNDNDNETNPIK